MRSSSARTWASRMPATRSIARMSRTTPSPISHRNGTSSIVRPGSPPEGRVVVVRRVDVGAGVGRERDALVRPDEAVAPVLGAEAELLLRHRDRVGVVEVLDRVRHRLERGGGIAEPLAEVDDLDVAPAEGEPLGAHSV